MTSTTTDPNSANNTSTVTTPVRASADVQLTQTGPASVLAGGAVSYTIKVKNAGPDPAAAVAVSDTLPAGLTGATATTTAGTCTIASGQVTCALGTLASGATATVTVSSTLSSSTTATSISNTASATSSTDDPNAANNSATVVTTVTPSSVCTSAGTVYGTQDFIQYAGRTSHTVHVQVTADCERDRTTGRIVLKSGSVLVTVDGQVLINAGTSALTLVSITTSRDAVVKGTYAETSFTVTLHDGECSSQGGDSIRVQYGSLDTSTLSPKRADVRIEKG